MPKREQVAPFVRKTFEMVSERSYSEIVSWSESGKSFIIWKPQKFRKTVIPLFFKHNNLCSFIRQLNTYGFHKVNKLKKEDFTNNTFPHNMNMNITPPINNDDILEFKHQYFVKNRKDLLSEIVRKKKVKSSSPGSPEPNNSVDSPDITGKRSHNEMLSSCESSPAGSPDLELYNTSSRQNIVKNNEGVTTQQSICSINNNTVLAYQSSYQNTIQEERLKEETIKMSNTISYLTYQIQILSSELKTSKEKINELENELFIANQFSSSNCDFSNQKRRKINPHMLHMPTTFSSNEIIPQHHFQSQNNVNHINHNNNNHNNNINAFFNEPSFFQNPFFADHYNSTTIANYQS